MKGADASIKSVVETTSYTEDHSVSSVIVLDELTYISQFDQAASMANIYNTLSNNDETQIAVARARTIFGELRRYINIKTGQFAAGRVAGTVFSYTSLG